MFLAALDHDEKIRRELFARYSAKGYTPDELNRCYNDKYLPYKSGRLDSAGKVPGAPYDMTVNPVSLFDTCLRRNMVMRVVAPAKGEHAMHGLGAVHTPLTIRPGNCPPCPPCAYPGGQATPPPPGRPYFYALDEGPRGRAYGQRYDLFKWLPPSFQREDSVPYDEFSVFSGLGAGPDPNTMTCEAVIKGYEKNALMATTRRADHAANAKARVQELEPFYNKCKGFAQAPTVENAVANELVSNISAGAGTSVTGQQTGGGAGQSASTMDWNKVAMVAGIGIGALVLLGVIAKKRSSKAATGAAK